MKDEVTVSRIHSREQYDELFRDGYDESARCLSRYYCEGYERTTEPFEYKGIGKYIHYPYCDRYSHGRQTDYYRYFLSEKEIPKEIQRIEKEIIRLQNLIEDIKKD